MRPAIFLDRDGTINEDLGYLANPEQVRILPGVDEALAILKKHHWLLILVSNQSGIGRGYFGYDELQAVQKTVETMLMESSVTLDGYYFCPHTPEDRCACRKPEPGLLLQASADLNIDLHRSWMIGDKNSDVIAGQRAGCKSILVHTNQEQGIVPQLIPEFVITKPDLLSAAHYIVGSSV